VPKITFLPDGTSIDVHEGVSLFNAAPRADVVIPSQCGGRCACALCRVEVVEGAEFLSPMSWDEEEHLGNSFHLTRERLSCQCRVFGDVVVKVVAPQSREKERGRFVPRSLTRKREEMERKEEMHRVHQDAGALGARPRGASQRTEQQGVGKKSGGPTRSSHKPARRKKRQRNPGAPRRGDSRAPPGAKKKDE
jgi:ferredoxin